MITLELTPTEIEELGRLEDGQTLDVEYNGLPCFIAYYPDYGNVEINGRRYSLGFYDPTEWKIKESKRVTVHIVFHFLHRNTEWRRFKTYRCIVKKAIRQYMRDFPELSECTDYNYTMFDEKGMLVK